MSSSTLSYDERRTVGLARLRDYVELMKPKISALSLATVTVGALTASWGLPNPLVLSGTLAATALLAASACAMNQLLERHDDALMQRTCMRPLPAGRLGAPEVCVFGMTSGTLGLTLLALVAGWAAALVGLLVWLLYVGVYTPLKTRTTANTAVGAVAGALPVWIGWTAAGGQFGLEAITLFMIVYLWQFPHFMAIAWLYRRDYAAAGMKMLPVVEPSGKSAARLSVASVLALVAVSYLPGFLHSAVPWYGIGATVLGLIYTIAVLRFAGVRDDRRARSLLKASLIYLPGMLGLLSMIAVS